MIPHSRPSISDQDRKAVDEVLASGQIADGATAAAFRADLSDYYGGIEVGLTTSGSQALAVALKACGIQAGDEVILPTYVCHQVADAVRSIGATVALCDVGERWNMNPETVARRVTAKTAAVVLVHMFGVFEPVEPYAAFGLNLIEDLAQAIAPPQPGKARLSSAAGFLSFHATKPITTGLGGAVLKRGLHMALGQAEAAPGIDDLSAALGRSQLERYPDMLQRRATIAEFYDGALPGGLTECVRSTRDHSVLFRYPLRTQKPVDFQKIQAEFAAKGVSIRRGVDELLHRRAGEPDAAFPASVAAFDTTISIPLYPALSDSHAEQVAAAVTSVLG